MRSFLKIFLIISIPILLVLFLGVSYSNKKFDKLSKEKIVSEMETNLQIIINYSDLNNLTRDSHNHLRKLYENSLIRITVIDKNTGKVLLDNSIDYDKIGELDNHLTRPEVKEAVLQGFGIYERYSNTINKNLIYYAKLVDDKIIRIAYPGQMVSNYAYEFKKLVLQLAIGVIIITLFLAAYFAKLVSVPIQKLNYIVDMISHGKKDIHFPNFNDPTMSKVSSLIYSIYHLMLNKQKELETSQERLNFILSIMDEAILLVDKNNNILHVNDAASEMFGLKNINNNIFNIITDAETIAFFKKILMLAESKTVVERYKKYTFEIYVKIMNEQNLFVIKDITNKKEYEVFKAELIGNISHELKTPLSMVMGYAETIINNKELDKETYDRFAKKIYDSSMRLNNLIDDIIKLHKLERLGKDFNIIEPVNFSEIKSEMSELFNDNKKEIVFNVQENYANVEYEHIVSILTNLIDNAVKYSLGEKVEVELFKKGNAVIIKVSDYGPIISENEKERIFERFYTTSRSRNKMNAGTGLGLSIVKHITGLYDGEIKLYKNNNFGNTFEVVLYEKKRI
jgi:two-component system phosphate regulon sensor histidine kinase PhoR